jgi:hypothetical protein
MEIGTGEEGRMKSQVSVQCGRQQQLESGNGRRPGIIVRAGLGLLGPGAEENAALPYGSSIIAPSDRITGHYPRQHTGKMLHALRQQFWLNVTGPWNIGENLRFCRPGNPIPLTDLGLRCSRCITLPHVFLHRVKQSDFGPDLNITHVRYYQTSLNVQKQMKSKPAYR